MIPASQAGQTPAAPWQAATDPIGQVGDSLRILPDRRRKQPQPPPPRKKPGKPGVREPAPPPADTPRHIDDYA